MRGGVGQRDPRQKNMPIKMILYVGTIIAIGGTLLSYNALNWICSEPLEYAFLLTLAILLSMFKVNMPGITGTYSPNSAVILIGVAQFEFSGTVIAAACAGLIQCLWRAKKKPTVLQALFNASVFAISAAAAYAIYRLSGPATHHSWIGALAYAMLAFFLLDTFLVSGVIAFVDRSNILEVWKTWHLWSLPH